MDVNGELMDTKKTKRNVARIKRYLFMIVRNSATCGRI